MPALLFPPNVNSAFFQLKPTLKPECPGSPEFFGKIISALDSNTQLLCKLVVGSSPRLSATKLQHKRNPRSSLNFRNSDLTNYGAPFHIASNGSHNLSSSLNPAQSTLPSNSCTPLASELSMIPAISNSPCVKKGMLKNFLYSRPHLQFFVRVGPEACHMHVLNITRDNILVAVHVHLVRHYDLIRTCPRAHQLRRRARPPYLCHHHIVSHCNVRWLRSASSLSVAFCSFSSAVPQLPSAVAAALAQRFSPFSVKPIHRVHPLSSLLRSTEPRLRNLLTALTRT